MASKCIDDYVTITSDTIGVRPLMTYGNVYKWPMAEAEFLRSITHGGSKRRSTVADSISCRQMYLRSYTFTTKETEEAGGEGGGEAVDRRNNRSCLGGGRKKAAKKAMKKNQRSSCRGFVFRLVWKCLSCASTTKVANIDD
ncbi:PREDICTED: uncharacterized protein LOC104780444 isoform X1 [Camelina sativa]|uniref:Uncharacterized protein LOC104780444 isoform X1 n=1 Tax=Camelina sativa TaxID=90675 RepID=A0ABM0YMI6_CAMSA|nr:PREDICTED: uncharacterized protein LOC104780444 isoform X1 [Camelina sativa]